MIQLQRYQGAVLGMAAGDALGTALEFRRPGSFEPISDITGGGPFGLRAGQWTDDTSMALALADSLVERSGRSTRAVRSLVAAGSLQQHRAMLRHRQYGARGAVAIREDRPGALRIDRSSHRRQRIADAPGSGSAVPGQLTHRW